MAGVPYVFGNATTSIPLTNLDANFNTGLTIGNTTVGLGNTVTTLGNVTLNNANFGAVANAVIYTNSSGNVTSNASVFSVNTGNVGIGTSVSINPLDAVGNIRSILASSGDQTGISLTNNGTTNGQVQFSTSDGSPRYYIQANGNTSLDFVTVLAGTNYTALSISRTTNNLTFGQSNAGIVFNNSSALTNSTLNDYETGTWTPTDASGA